MMLVYIVELPEASYLSFVDGWIDSRVGAFLFPGDFRDDDSGDFPEGNFTGDNFLVDFLGDTCGIMTTGFTFFGYSSRRLTVGKSRYPAVQHPVAVFSPAV